MGESPPIGGEFVPGEVVLLEKRGAQVPDIDGAIIGAEELQRLPRLGLHRIQLPPGLSVEEAIPRYSALPWVEAVQPNYVIRGDIIPNDPLYGTQSWYYNLLEAPAGWDTETGSTGVVVATIDSGIDLTHPDLNDNLWINPGEVIDGADNDANGIPDDRHGAAFISLPSSGCSSPAPGDPDDDEDQGGHGTSVGGIIGAETNTSPALGVAGTSWRVSLMAAKALDCNNAGNTFDAAQAIDYAATEGADVINMSFSICLRNPCPSGPCQTPTAPPDLAAAISSAQQTYGTVFIGAAGNDNCPDVAYPAAFPEVIAVGASGGSGSPNSRAGFSNWGPEIDVAAPGVQICSTAWTQSLADTYACSLAGTSFSAPLASGLAALLISRDPFLTHDEVRTIIKSSAVNLPDGSTPNWDGAGRINIRDALELTSFRSFIPGISRD